MLFLPYSVPGTRNYFRTLRHCICLSLNFPARKQLYSIKKKKYCVASSLKPGNFEPQLLHLQLFTHEEFMVHIRKHSFFLGKWTLGFDATTSGLIFISPSWMSARENQEGTAHSSVTHSWAAWCWSASSWNMCFNGSVVCWQPRPSAFQILTENQQFWCWWGHTGTLDSKASPAAWELNCPFSVPLDQHLYRHELWVTSFSWN